MSGEPDEPTPDPSLAGWQHVLDGLPAVDAGEPSTEPHRPIDALSLIGGIVVLVLSAAFAFGDLDSFEAQGEVIWPTIVLGVGAALLATIFRR